MIRARRRRSRTWRRFGSATVPYLLLLPVVIVIGGLLGYPIYSLVRLSFQQYGLFELVQHKGRYIGLHNFESVLHDKVFWHTLFRTIVFTVANVGLTMVGGTLIALLLVRVSMWARIMLTAGLVLVWSMPQVVAVEIWNWMTNYQNGVISYVLTELRFGDYFHHDWLGTPLSQLGLVTALVVWGALPFVAITVFAALSQVPKDLIEAAEIDGARGVRVFFDVTVPILKPVLLILTSLSILWDFGVFTQPFLLIGQAHLGPSNYLMGVYLYEEGYLRTDFGRGAAISILMLVIVAAMSIVYIRRMVRMGETD